jgi:hypothetical protein
MNNEQTDTDSIGHNVSTWKDLEAKRISCVASLAAVKLDQKKIEEEFREYLIRVDADELHLGPDHVFVRYQKEVVKLSKESVQQAIGEAEYCRLVSDNTISKVVFSAKKRKADTRV